MLSLPSTHHLQRLLFIGLYPPFQQVPHSCRTWLSPAPSLNVKILLQTGDPTVFPLGRQKVKEKAI